MLTRPSRMTRGSLPFYRDVISVLEQSDVHIKAFVIDKRARDPFDGVPQWDAQARATAQLLIGSINKDEVATALMDECSTPVGVSIAENVRDRVNERLGSTALTAAVSLNSRSTDGLQLADLVAGAIHFDRHSRMAEATSTRPSSVSPKGQVSASLAAAFGVRDFRDMREGRVSILTARAPRRRRLHLAETSTAA